MAIKTAIASTAWENSATWDLGSVPTSADDVDLNGYGVDLSTSVTVASLTANGGNINVQNVTITIHITGNAELSDPGYSGGTIKTGSGNVTLTIDGTLSCNIGVAVSVEASATITVTGGITADVTDAVIYVNNGGTATVNADATITSAGNLYGGFDGSITVNGNVSVAGSGTGVVLSNDGGAVIVTVNGDITVTNGTGLYLQMGGHARVFGTITATSASAHAFTLVGSTLFVTNVTLASGGVASLNRPSTVISAGTLSLAGGTVTNNGLWLHVGTATMSGVHWLIPTTADVRSGIAYLGSFSKSGTLSVPSVSNVLSGIAVDTGTGSLILPTAANVRLSTVYGVGGTGSTGTLAVPSATTVLSGTAVDATTGSLVLPSTVNVRSGTVYGVGGTGSTGTAAIPSATTVLSGTAVGAGTGTLVLPTAANVRLSTVYGVGGNGSTGTLDLPAQGDVKSGVVYDNTTKIGTLAAAPSAGYHID